MRRVVIIKVRLLILVFASLFTSGTIAQPKLPLKGVEFTELNLKKCKVLEKNLKKELAKNQKWKTMISGKRMSIAIVDLTNIKNPRFAGINSDHMMYAASLPKIAILYAVMDALEKETVQDTETIRADLRQMISKSNNAAATRMIDLVGYEKIEEVLRKANPALYDEASGGGLWVGKRYAAGGKRYPDPMKGLSHAATAYQAANFYYALVYGELISYDRSSEMLEILKDPELEHKFVNTLHSIAPNAALYRKSGSWKQYHSDSILVWGPSRRYILVALLEDNQGEQIIRKLVRPIEKVIKNSQSLKCSE